MSAPQLRVHRTYRWVSDPVTVETRFGAPIGMHMATIDILEYWEPMSGKEGAWLPVPVVEDVRPPYPESERSHHSAMLAADLDAFRKAVREL